MGGILRIALEDEVQTAKNMGTNNSIEYKDAYSGNLNAAIQRVKASGSSSFPSRETSLVKVLTRGRLVCELQTHTLPRPLKSRHLDLSGATIKVGHCEGTVKRELGRGVYGVVALLDRGDSQEIAIKAQSPAGCLAHEYEILRSIEDRVGEDDKKQSFPRALSFLYFADGALLGMTAASASGLNLIDLVNIYTKHGERIPEILALHYTARMLVHIEALHWKAKILVCLLHLH